MSDILFLVIFMAVVGTALYWFIRIALKKERVWLVTVESAREQMRKLLPTSAVTPLVLVKTPHNVRSLSVGGEQLEYWIFGINQRTKQALLWRVRSDKTQRYESSLSEAILELPVVSPNGSWRVWQYSFIISLRLDAAALVNCESGRFFLPDEKIKSRGPDHTAEDVLSLIQSLQDCGVKIDSTKFLGKEQLL